MDAGDYLRSVMTPLRPRPTGWEPALKELSGIEVVVFDIYGTLIQSAAGEVGLESETSSANGMRRAIRALGCEGEPDIGNWVDRYHLEIERRQSEARIRGIAHPEIEIRDVWRALARELGQTEASVPEIEQAAICYECAVNPTWKMPGAGTVLADLRRQSIPLGILSNAQFYTRTVVEAAFGLRWDSLGFDESICLFSFEEGCGKPSGRLFENLRERIEAAGYRVEEVLYIGNDVRKDIKPARAVGFRTGLFAGDARSLRCDSGGEREARENADVVLTEWSQWGEVLPCRSHHEK